MIGESPTPQITLAQRLHIDPPLLVSLLLLSGLGLVVLYSASGADLQMVEGQALRLGIAFATMFGVAQISPDTLRRWSPWLYGLGLIMLVAVLVMGEIGKGAQRWLDLGVLRFQPSELMKLAVPTATAAFLARMSLPPRFWPVVFTGLIFVIPAVLVAKQPDLGTALLVGSSGMFVLLFGGLRWRVIAAGALVAVPLIWLLWEFGMHDYQRRRVLTFLNPETDPLGAGYHIIQSTIAIGSGGMYGKGWLKGTQSHLEFLPERHTDFIFAVFGEEFGLMAVLLLLALYGFIVMRGLYIAANGQDTFSRLLAGSVIMTFFVYVFVNIGMVSGILPVVGVPLPLISRGGTSMVTLFAAFGILMSVQTHHRLIRS